MKVAILADFPLHVIPELGEAFRPAGHYATWLPQLAEAFENCADLQVHWIVVSSRLTVTREILWKKQHFHVLPTTAQQRASTLFHADRMLIRKVLVDLRPDLVHGWGTEDVYGFAAATSSYPNLVSLQGILTHYALKCRLQPRDYFQALLELYVLWRARHLTVESQWGKKCLQRRNPGAKISLVEYGVQPCFFEVAWKPDPQCPAAIFVGSITPRKGIQDLVAAFRSPALAGAELWVVGGTTKGWGEKLRLQAPPNVRWLGRQTAQETADLMSRAWCLVLPTRADTCPNVVKEARVIGLPVITSTCGGQVSYVENDRNGFLVNTGDVRQLASRCAQLFGDLNATKKMGSHRHAEQRAWFRPENTAREFSRIYREWGKKDA